jgi:hypothetical protein
MRSEFSIEENGWRTLNKHMVFIIENHNVLHWKEQWYWYTTLNVQRNNLIMEMFNEIGGTIERSPSSTIKKEYKLFRSMRQHCVFLRKEAKKKFMRMTCLSCVTLIND